MATFNGYPSHAHWNTALWLNNDEHFYVILRKYADAIATDRLGLLTASKLLLNELPEQTPDRVNWQEGQIELLLIEQTEEIEKQYEEAIRRVFQRCSR
jgi:hypothetical protein|tara:strand:+ start:246 stop:539 length:294 start_codon:yes stop_codon:yes gene_type:complete